MSTSRNKRAAESPREWRRRWGIATGITASVAALVFLGWLANTTWGPAARPASTVADALVPPPLAQGGGVLLSGTVDAVETDVLGRPSKVAIVSLARGLLVETAVEDGLVGEELKEHVGEQVRARGVVKVNADGSTSFVVASFELAPSRG